MAAAPDPADCARCRFYVPVKRPYATEPSGRCQRFPQTVEKQPGDFCGEYRLNPQLKPPPKKGSKR